MNAITRKMKGVFVLGCLLVAQAALCYLVVCSNGGNWAIRFYTNLAFSYLFVGPWSIGLLLATVEVGDGNSLEWWMGVLLVLFYAACPMLGLVTPWFVGTCVVCGVVYGVGRLAYGCSRPMGQGGPTDR